MSIDRDALEKHWTANEAELNRIAAAPGLDRELLAKRVDELEAEQDSIEFALGFDEHVNPESRRWSGSR